jgi:6-phosphogluconolactonase
MSARAQRRVIIAQDAQALAETAAARLFARIEQTPHPAMICLTGGTTPKQLYQLLATSPWRERIPWPRVHWFLSDDRFVPQDDDLSNSGMARRAFLDACAPPQNIHAIRTDVETPDEAARLYELELHAFHPMPLESAPLFDLVLLGVGSDGHVASLFPNTEAANETRRWAVGVQDAGLAPFVPRVSLTLPVLCAAREVLFLVSGESKRDIIARVFAGDDLPATRIHAAQGETVWLLDRAAAPPNLKET